MADEKRDESAPLEPEELDEVAGGAYDAFLKIDPAGGTAESFQKINEIN
jgi:hypothetical protein